MATPSQMPDARRRLLRSIAAHALEIRSASPEVVIDAEELLLLLGPETCQRTAGTLGATYPTAAVPMGPPRWVPRPGPVGLVGHPGPDESPSLVWVSQTGPLRLTLSDAWTPGGPQRWTVEVAVVGPSGHAAVVVVKECPYIAKAMDWADAYLAGTLPLEPITTSEPATTDGHTLERTLAPIGTPKPHRGRCSCGQWTAEPVNTPEFIDSQWTRHVLETEGTVVS